MNEITTPYTLGSLFDGSGGFPLAGTLCGIEPRWASEVEPYPIAVTRERFPRVKHLGDISKINGAEIEPVDIITFGSPCQDLSVAGKRAGLKHEANGDEETTRSGLFMEAVRIIKEMRRATNGKYPRFALWENVPGAFSSNKGEDFRVVCEELIKIVEPRASMPEVPKNGWAYADSYIGDGWSLAYRTFDAQYWGVPQRRRRIHLIADFRGERAREVLFEREGVRGYLAQGRTPWQTTPTNAEGSTGADDREGDRGLDAIAYSFDSLASNSMKSSNPHSGCRKVDIAKTLDTTDPNPSKNQGGIAIVESVGFDVYNQCPSGNVPMVMEPVPETNFIDVEMEVAVRKYEVNTALLCECLRDHKAASGFSNKDMAEQLNRPITEVEHWFRTDKCFAIPSPEVWLKLKKLLGITTEEFDESIMIFEFKGGNYDMRNRIHTGEVSPTLTCGSGNDLHLLPSDPVYCLQGNGIDIDRVDTAGCNGKGRREDASYTLNTLDRPAVVYAVDQGGGKSSASVTEDKSPTLCTTHGGEPVIALDRASFNQGQNAKYDFEISDSGVNSTIVARGPSAVAFCVADHPTPKIDEKGKAFTLNARDYKAPLVAAYKTPPRYIVRRLTPTECARLQGFADCWGHIEKKDSLTDEELSFWQGARDTYALINGKEPKAYTEKQMLTWYNKLWTDSAEYKMWGNGIALPPALYCMQGIVDALNTEEEDDSWMM